MSFEKSILASGYKGPSDLLEKLCRIRDTIRGKENIRLIAKSLNDIAPVLVQIPPVQFIKGREMFRARIHSDNYHGLPTHISQLGVRESRFVSNYGRANLPHQSVFYAGNAVEVAVSETTRWHNDDYNILMHQDLDAYMKTNAIDEAQRAALEKKMHDHIFKKLTISCWRAKEPLLLVPILDPAKVLEQSFQEVINKKNVKPDDMSEFMWGYDHAIHKFFRDEFARLDFCNEDDYLLTAIYANQLYKNMVATNEQGHYIGVDGIIYLSCANGLLGYNYALAERALPKIEFQWAHDVIALNRNRYSENIQALDNLVTDKYGILDIGSEALLDPLTGIVM